MDDFSSFWIINLRIHQQIKQNNYPYVKFLFQKDACLIIFNFHFPKKLPKQAFFCSFGQFPDQTKQVAMLPAWFFKAVLAGQPLSFSIFSILTKLSKLLCFPPVLQSCPGQTATFFLYFFNSYQTKQVAMLPASSSKLSWSDSYFLYLACKTFACFISFSYCNFLNNNKCKNHKNNSYKKTYCPISYKACDYVRDK